MSGVESYCGLNTETQIYLISEIATTLLNGGGGGGGGGRNRKKTTTRKPWRLG